MNTKFQGFQKRSIASEIAFGFGIAGALTAMAIKCEYEAETLLYIELIDNSNGDMIWCGEVDGAIQGVDSASPHGVASCFKASLSLKEAMNNLVSKIITIKI